MKEDLFIWVRNIAYYMILVTAMMQVMPNKSFQKYMKLFTGMILILMMTSPLLELFGLNPEKEALLNIEKYREKMEEIERDTEYLYEIDASDYVKENEETSYNINIDRIEIGD